MNAEELVAQVRHLPSLPQSTVKLLTLLGDRRCDNHKIVQLVQRDLVLTAKLLRWCNSAFMGGSQEVTSVDEAVFRLGHETVVKAVMALNAGPALRGELFGYDMEESALWRHSLGTAMAAELIVAAVFPGVLDPATAFTAGLLHDFGKVVLNHVLTPEVQAELHSLIEDNTLSWTEAERDVLGTNHAEVGACLLTRWRIPEIIVDGVARHHEPIVANGSAVGLPMVLHLADCAAHMTCCTAGWNSYAERAHGEIAAQMGVLPEDFERLLTQVYDSMDSLKPFMELA